MANVMELVVVEFVLAALFVAVVLGLQPLLENARLINNNILRRCDGEDISCDNRER